MKSREEYLASIFAKRDALLKKRKSRISQTIAVLSIAVCFAAVFHFVPKKLTKSPVSDETTTTIASTKPMTAEIEEAVTENIYTAPLIYTMTVTYDSLQRIEKTEITQETLEYNAEHEIGCSAETTEKTSASQTEGDKKSSDEHADSASFLKPNSNFGYSPISPESSEQNEQPRSNESIENTAFNCLTDEEKELCQKVEPEITVTNQQNGQSFYTVYYFTDYGNIEIKLSYNNLELIDKESKISETTKPLVMTTPAYNPNI